MVGFALDQEQDIADRNVRSFNARSGLTGLWCIMKAQRQTVRVGRQIYEK